MKERLLILIFVLLCWPTLAEIDSRIGLYNEAFEKKDYTKALVIIESLVASFPYSIDYHREKAKMLAATNQKAKFIEEMTFIRNMKKPENISTFFSVLTHDFVSKDLRDDLRRLFSSKQDTTLLLSWPKFPDDKVVVVSKVYGQSQTLARSKSFNAPAQPSYNRPVRPNEPENSPYKPSPEVERLGEKYIQQFKEAQRIIYLHPSSLPEFERITDQIVMRSAGLDLYESEKEKEEYRVKAMKESILDLGFFIKKWQATEKIKSFLGD